MGVGGVWLGGGGACDVTVSEKGGLTPGERQV